MIDSTADLAVKNTEEINPSEADQVNCEKQSDWNYHWDIAASTINHSNAKINISVVSPEIISSLMSKHVVYSVKTDPLGYTVRRRYNDFAWLKDALSLTYAGLFIPAIPSTTLFTTKGNITGSKTDICGDFVKNRMAQLHQFMQQLVKIPFVRSDPALIGFVSIQSEKEFKQFMDNQTVVNKLDNDGLKLWFSLIDKTVITEHDSNRVITDFKRQLDMLRTTLDNLDKECRFVGKKAVQCAKGMASLADHVSLWTDTENDLLDTNRNEFINLHGARLKVYLNALSSGQNVWSQNVALIPKVIARVFMSNIQFQLVQVEGFRQHLIQRDSLLRDLERAEREKVKALEEKHRASSSGTTPPRRSSVNLFTKKADDLEDMVVKKTDAVNALQTTVARINRALIYCEIDRFNKERVHSISVLVGSLAATHIQISQAATTKWSEIVALSGLETSEFTDCVSGVYTNLDEEEIFGDN